MEVLTKIQIFMKVMIKLTQAEVSGIVSYLAEVEGVSASAVNVESIAEEVRSRLYHALRDPREAISDHINEQEKTRRFRLTVIERDGSGDGISFQPCGVDRLFEKLANDYEVFYSLHETTGAREKVLSLKLGETFTFEASRDDKRAFAVLLRVG